MNERTDQQLLCDYAEHHSEPAFGELVRRYVDFVHSAALRMVRDAHLAEDVTQSVFVALARAARQLSDRIVLSGWLHRTTQNLAANVVRSDVRRRVREQEAAVMSALLSADSDTTWDQVAMHLDDAIGELSELDRDALLFRYFERKSAREMAQILGISHEAAQRRVTRAVERLRELFAKRGVAVSAGGLVVVISANAVLAAPVELAVTVSNAVLAATAVPTSIAIAATKTIVMSTLQKAIAGVAIALGVTAPWAIHHLSQKRILEENESLRLQVMQLAVLSAENERLSNLIAQAQSPLSVSQEATPMPRLPAPQRRPTAQTAEFSTEEVQSTQRIAQLLKGEESPRMTAEQIRPYLEQNRRNAASLLAAFRATGDPALLEEALEKYPNNPQVNFAAIFKKDATSVERRQHLESFKQAAPENSLGNYLSAMDYFKSGENDQAVRELSVASGKMRFQDYTAEFIQDNDEVWRTSGYPVAEAKVVASSSLVLDHLVQLKQLAQETVTLAESYRQAGDSTSAQLALQMGANLGQRFAETPGEPLITQLVGIAIESIALRSMDPAKHYGDTGQTVQGRLDELVQQRSTIRDLTKRFAAVQPSMSAQDWISYVDRCRIFGEEVAAQWVIAKHGQN